MSEFESAADHAQENRPNKAMLVAWALGECGGDREFVDKVDVSMFAFRSYPRYFGYQRYPEHPDVSAVRLQLYDLLKRKNSHLFGYGDEVTVAEKTREGNSSRFRLTPAGVAWWRTNRDWIGHWVERNSSSELATAKSVGGQVKTEDDHKRALIARIRATAGFAAWSRDPTISRRQLGIQTFFTAFGIGPRTARPEYVEARDLLLSAASSDEELTRFLNVLDDLFGGDYKRMLTGEVEI
jgi:hypothetical protein